MQTFLIFGTIFLVIDVTTEFIKRKFKLDPEKTRTGLHVVSTLITATLPLFMDRNYIIALSVIFTLFLLASKRMNILTSIHGVKRKTVGELIYSASIGVSAFLFLPDNINWYFASIIILAISDPLANIIGRKIKSKKLVFDKTVAGSLAFLISSFAISAYFLDLNQAIMVASFATIAELYSKNGYDNITIVLATYFALLIS